MPRRERVRAERMRVEVERRLAAIKELLNLPRVTLVARDPDDGENCYLVSNEPDGEGMAEAFELAMTKVGKKGGLTP